MQKWNHKLLVLYSAADRFDVELPTRFWWYHVMKYVHKFLWMALNSSTPSLLKGFVVRALASFRIRLSTTIQTIIKTGSLSVTFHKKVSNLSSISFSTRAYFLTRCLGWVQLVPCQKLFFQTSYIFLYVHSKWVANYFQTASWCNYFLQGQIRV